MNVPKYIAQRFLKSGGELSLLKALTRISITGVAIGVALLIVVMSVFNGFFDVVEGVLRSWDPDLRIIRVDGKPFDQKELIPIIESDPDIAHFTPFIEGKALMATRNQDKVVFVKGVPLTDFFEKTSVQDAMLEGSMELGFENGRLGLLIGRRLAYDMSLRNGDEVALLSAAGMQKRLTQFTAPRTVPFEIRGIYNMQELFEGSSIFIDFLTAARLFETRGAIHGFDVQLVDRMSYESVQEQVQSKLPDGYRVESWYSLQKPVYDVMKLEKKASFIFLMIIVVVAVLNIIASLSMIVIRKQRDLSILRTMGMQSKEIAKIFIRQGWQIGLLGSISGLFLGGGLAYVQARYKVVKLSDAFIIDAYPIAIQWQDIVIVLCGATLLCVIASFYPAMKAAKGNIIEGIRS